MTELVRFSAYLLAGYYRQQKRGARRAREMREIAARLEPTVPGLSYQLSSLCDEQEADCQMIRRQLDTIVIAGQAGIRPQSLDPAQLFEADDRL